MQKKRMKYERKDFYEYYKKHSKYKMGYREWLRTIVAFHNYIIERVVDGEIVKLPKGLGKLKIYGKKNKPQIDKKTGTIKGLAPNWKETAKLWQENPEAKEQRKIIFFLNEHSDMVRYRYVWTKRGVRAKNKDMYHLRMSHFARNRLARAIFFEGKTYPINNKNYEEDRKRKTVRIYHSKQNNNKSKKRST